MPSTCSSEEPFRMHIHNRVKKFFQIENTTGLEIFSMLQGAARISEMLECQMSEDKELSGPRWRLMLRLLVDEMNGNTCGLTPTSLSHSRQVSKNTTSSLLRGLEEQGLIQRNLDPNDLRVFRIQLTPKGRELTQRSIPDRIKILNSLLSDLSTEDIDQLGNLLDKLRLSLIEKVHHSEKEPVIISNIER